MVEAPSTSSDEALQDKFNSDVAQAIKEILETLIALEERIVALEP